MKVYLEDSSLTAIADAIREKNGETTAYKPAEMASAIAAIETGGGSSESYNLVYNIITPSAATGAIDLSPYISSPDDLVAMTWTGNTIKGVSGGNQKYLRMYFANPNGEMLLAYVGTSSSTTYHYIYESVQITSARTDYYVFGIDENLQARVYNASKSNFDSEAFQPRKIIIVTKDRSEA